MARSPQDLSGGWSRTGPFVMGILALVLAACGTTSNRNTATLKVPADEAGVSIPPMECAKYAYYGIYCYSAPSHSKNETFAAADSKAHADFEAANAAAEKNDHQAAARLFFSCAVQYRATPEAAPALEYAIKNSTLCYKNSMYAFANAGRFASEGAPRLRQAMADDPRLAAAIKGMLAKAPADCANPK